MVRVKVKGLGLGLSVCDVQCDVPDTGRDGPAIYLRIPSEISMNFMWCPRFCKKAEMTFVVVTDSSIYLVLWSS